MSNIPKRHLLKIVGIALCVLAISGCALFWGDEGRTKGNTTAPVPPSSFFFTPVQQNLRLGSVTPDTVLGTFSKDDSCNGIGAFRYSLPSSSTNDNGKFLISNTSDTAQLKFDGDFSIAAGTFRINVRATDMDGSYDGKSIEKEFKVTVLPRFAVERAEITDGNKLIITFNTPVGTITGQGFSVTGGVTIAGTPTHNAEKTVYIYTYTGSPSAVVSPSLDFSIYGGANISSNDGSALSSSTFPVTIHNNLTPTESAGLYYSSGINVGRGTFESALTYLNDSYTYGGTYTLVLDNDESINNGSIFGVKDFKPYYTTTLVVKGKTTPRTLTFTSTYTPTYGYLRVGSSTGPRNVTATLVLGKNITLKGSTGNKAPLVWIEGGKLSSSSSYIHTAELIMYSGSKITGNTNSNTTGDMGLGGGVLVSNYARFYMAGGEISGNTAQGGGGVYHYWGIFKKTGGTIYGSNEGANSNTATSTTLQGHAVYDDATNSNGSVVKRRNATAGETVDLDGDGTMNWE